MRSKLIICHTPNREIGRQTDKFQTVDLLYYLASCRVLNNTFTAIVASIPHTVTRLLVAHAGLSSVAIKLLGLGKKKINFIYINKK